MGNVSIIKAVMLNGEEMNKVDKYLCTQGKENISLRDVDDGTVLTPVGYVYFTDTRNEEVSEVLAILCDDGGIYTTVSATFRRSFDSIVEIMGEDKFSIKKLSGTTKNNREYIDCGLVVER